MTLDQQSSRGPRVVFMGSPEFAVPSLNALVDAGYDVALVVSQPDRPAGRGRKVQRPPVAARAEELGLAAYQPATLRHEETRAPIEAITPDLIVVAAFGLLLPPAILQLPRHRCINVHASLLPRHRGAAPIQASILAGDAQTGVSIMLMDEGMDTGAVLTQAATPITPGDDAPTVDRRLAKLGSELLLETIPEWINGSLQPRPQDDSEATYAPRIKREEARLDWPRSAEQIARAVRAYRGWPNAFTTWQDQTLLILEAEAVPDESRHDTPGRVVIEPGASWSPAVATGQGLLHLRQIQLQGRRPVSARDFLNGQPSFRGATLGQ